MQGPSQESAGLQLVAAAAAQQPFQAEHLSQNSAFKETQNSALAETQHTSPASAIADVGAHFQGTLLICNFNGRDSNDGKGVQQEADNDKGIKTGEESGSSSGDEYEYRGYFQDTSDEPSTMGNSHLRGISLLGSC